ncbi:MAG: lysylphosphatidylglycerol synthase transmembrane domain-containing protein [Vicinamibacterales bacterium]
MRSSALDSTPAETERQRTSWKGRVATILSIVISGGLLVVLYRSLHISLVTDALLHADKTWLLVSVGMIIPITVLRAVRFYWVAPAGSLPGTGEALRLTLVASALNVFLPAKAGDLIKSYFVATRSDTPAGVALSIVVYERLCDMFGLIAWCLVGWVVGRPQIAGINAAFWLMLAVLGTVCFVLISSERAATWVEAAAKWALVHHRLKKLSNLSGGWLGLLKAIRGRRRFIVSYSLVLWLAHLFQIWLFSVALSVSIPFTVSASLSAVALMAGQIPLTFAGLGARDVALVVLLARYMTPEMAAAMGLLISTRGLLPPLLGLPVMRPYLSSTIDDARTWRRRMDAI